MCAWQETPRLPNHCTRSHSQAARLQIENPSRVDERTDSHTHTHTHGNTRLFQRTTVGEHAKTHTTKPRPHSNALASTAQYWIIIASPVREAHFVGHTHALHSQLDSPEDYADKVKCMRHTRTHARTHNNSIFPVLVNECVYVCVLCVRVCVCAVCA